MLPPRGSEEISLKSRQQQTELAIEERLLLGLRKHMHAADTQRKGLFAKWVVVVMGSQKFQSLCKGQFFCFFFLNSSFLPFIPSTSLLPLPTPPPSPFIWGKAFHGNQHSMVCQVEAEPSSSLPPSLLPPSRLNKASDHRV